MQENSSPLSHFLPIKQNSQPTNYLYQQKAKVHQVFPVGRKVSEKACAITPNRSRQLPPWMRTSSARLVM
jgi:hypothetical protein